MIDNPKINFCQTMGEKNAPGNYAKKLVEKFGEP